MIMGRHSTNATAQLVAETEAVQAATVTASVGTLREKGPAGIGRTDEIPYTPKGFDPVYATWDLDGTAATIRFVTPMPLAHPTLRIFGWSGTPTVTLDGAAL